MGTRHDLRVWLGAGWQGRNPAPMATCWGKPQLPLPGGCAEHETWQQAGLDPLPKQCQAAFRSQGESICSQQAGFLCFQAGSGLLSAKGT